MIMTVCKSNTETEMFCIFALHIYNLQFTIYKFQLTERKKESAFGFIQSGSLAIFRMTLGGWWLQQNCITTEQRTTKQLSHKIKNSDMRDRHPFTMHWPMFVCSTEHFLKKNYIAADTFPSIPYAIFLAHSIPTTYRKTEWRRTQPMEI